MIFPSVASTAINIHRLHRRGVGGACVSFDGYKGMSLKQKTWDDTLRGESSLKEVSAGVYDPAKDGDN